MLKASNTANGSGAVNMIATVILVTLGLTACATGAQSVKTLNVGESVEADGTRLTLSTTQDPGGHQVFYAAIDALRDNIACPTPDELYTTTAGTRLRKAFQPNILCGVLNQGEHSSTDVISVAILGKDFPDLKLVYAPSGQVVARWTIPPRFSAPSAEPAPPVEEIPTSPPVEEIPTSPAPTSTRTPPPVADGTVPRDAPVGAGDHVAGAFAVTNLVISDKDPTNKTVSFTVKNTTKKVVNLLPQVSVKEDTETLHIFALWGGEQGPGVICHTLRPNESERITLGEGYSQNIGGSEGDRSFPINWTSAEVYNGPQGC